MESRRFPRGGGSLPIAPPQLLQRREHENVSDVKSGVGSLSDSLNDDATSGVADNLAPTSE